MPTHLSAPPELLNIKKTMMTPLGANIFSYLYSLPFAVVVLLAFFLRLYLATPLRFVPLYDRLYAWGQTMADNIFTYLPLAIAYILGFYLLTALSELLRGLITILFGRLPVKSLSFRFSPAGLVCQCKAIMPLYAYRLALLLPVLLVCLPISVLAVFSADYYLIVLAVILLMVSGKDIGLFWMTRVHPQKSPTWDMVGQTGCYIFRAPKNKTKENPKRSLFADTDD